MKQIMANFLAFTVGGYIYLLGTLNSLQHYEEMSGLVGDYAKKKLFYINI